MTCRFNNRLSMIDVLEPPVVIKLLVVEEILTRSPIEHVSRRISSPRPESLLSFTMTPRHSRNTFTTLSGAVTRLMSNTGFEDSLAGGGREAVWDNYNFENINMIVNNKNLPRIIRNMFVFR